MLRCKKFLISLLSLNIINPAPYGSLVIASQIGALPASAMYCNVNYRCPLHNVPNCPAGFTVISPEVLGAMPQEEQTVWSRYCALEDTYNPVPNTFFYCPALPQILTEALNNETLLCYFQQAQRRLCSLFNPLGCFLGTTITGTGTNTPTSTSTLQPGVTQTLTSTSTPTTTTSSTSTTSYCGLLSNCYWFGTTTTKTTTTQTSSTSTETTSTSSTGTSSTSTETTTTKTTTSTTYCGYIFGRCTQTVTITSSSTQTSSTSSATTTTVTTSTSTYCGIFSKCYLLGTTTTTTTSSITRTGTSSTETKTTTIYCGYVIGRCTQTYTTTASLYPRTTTTYCGFLWNSCVDPNATTTTRQRFSLYQSLMSDAHGLRLNARNLMIIALLTMCALS